MNAAHERHGVKLVPAVPPNDAGGVLVPVAGIHQTVRVDRAGHERHERVAVTVVDRGAVVVGDDLVGLVLQPLDQSLGDVVGPYHTSEHALEEHHAGAIHQDGAVRVELAESEHRVVDVVGGLGLEPLELGQRRVPLEVLDQEVDLVDEVADATRASRGLPLFAERRFSLGGQPILEFTQPFEHDVAPIRLTMETIVLYHNLY